MKFYLVDVKSAVIVNGVEVAFDYMNTYYDPDKAIAEAELLRKNPDVLDVGVHEWILKEDGTDEHSGNCLYHFNYISDHR